MWWIKNSWPLLFIFVLTLLPIFMPRAGIYQQVTEPTHDPIYNQRITSDVPFIVYQTRVNDDIVPDVYQVWYNPMTEQYTDFILEGE